MFLILTHTTKKIIDAMVSTKEPIMIEQEGMYVDLIAIHEEYLDNALVVN